MGFAVLSPKRFEEIKMTLTTILVILLVLLLIGALPVYPYSRGWGYYPSGILVVVVAVVALMLLL
jgi:membrane protein YdbS with pleckstrin-like domain